MATLGAATAAAHVGRTMRDAPGAGHVPAVQSVAARAALRGGRVRVATVRRARAPREATGRERAEAR
jgi:hypothetical protein